MAYTCVSAFSKLYLANAIVIGLLSIGYPVIAAHAHDVPIAAAAQT